MSKDIRIVVGIVIVALLFGSIPVFVPLVFGIGLQAGAWTNQAIHSAFFLFFTKLYGLGLIVSISGLGLSIYFRKRNPRKFRLTLISFVILLVGTTLSAVISAWVEINYVQAGIPAQQTAVAYSAVTCVSALTNISVWVMIFVATFSKKLNPIDEVVSTDS